MTIWARRSLFRQEFDMDKWDLSVEEKDESVVFVVELVGDVQFDLDSFGFDNTLEMITAVGQDSADLLIGNDFTGVRVEVPRTALPEDYLD